MTTFQNCRSIYIFNYLLQRHIDRAAVAHSQFKQCLIYVPSLSRERGTRTGLFVSGMRLFVSGMQPATRLTRHSTYHHLPPKHNEDLQLYLKHNIWRDNIGKAVKTSRWRDAIIDDTLLNLNRNSWHISHISIRYHFFLLLFSTLRRAIRGLRLGCWRGLVSGGCRVSDVVCS